MDLVVKAIGAIVGFLGGTTVIYIAMLVDYAWTGRQRCVLSFPSGSVRCLVPPLLDLSR